MPNPVELKVRSQLKKIVDDLEQIRGQAEAVNESFSKMGDEVSKNINENTKTAGTFLEKLRSHGRRVADHMRRDFESLIGLNAIAGSLKLSEQFRDSAAEAVRLSDQIRKLGTSFGIPQKNFESFHSRMIKGLGQLGLASEVGSRTMEGLLNTPVKGQEALLEYSKVAGQLASISGQKGQEGAIAKGIAEVIRARGGDPNDPAGMRAIAEDLRKAFNVTGQRPDQVLGAMQDIFTGMSEDLRKKIDTGALVNIAAAGQVAGPEATTFLEEFTQLSKTQRAGLEARGVGKLITKEGLDVEALRRFGEEAKRLGGGDLRLGMKAMGIASDEAAEGAIRLVENLDRVQEAQEAFARQTGTLGEQFRNTRGLGEAFQANINRVKKALAEPISKITGGLTDVLSKTAESDVGAAAVVGGGGLLAALLAGGGLRALGKGMGVGGLAKGAAIEAMTGREVQPVYVVNAGEIGGGISSALGGSGMGGKALGVLGKAGGVAAAAGAGYMAGQALNPVIDRYTQGTTEEGFKGSIVERLFFKLDKLIGGESANQIMAGLEAERKLRVQVEMADPRLREAKRASRGASF